MWAYRTVEERVLGQVDHPESSLTERPCDAVFENGVTTWGEWHGCGLRNARKAFDRLAIGPAIFVWATGRVGQSLPGFHEICKASAPPNMAAHTGGQALEAACLKLRSGLSHSVPGPEGLVV